MPSYTTSKPTEGGASFLVEPGEYELRLIDAKESMSQAGNEMLELTHRIILPDGSEGPKVYDRLVFTEKAMWRVDQYVAACGKHPGEGQTLDLYPSLMFGWTCRAKLKVGEYNNKKRNEIEEYLIDESTIGAVAGQEKEDEVPF